MSEKDYKESDPFYHSKEWKRLRQMAIERDRGMCCECMRKFQMGIIKRPHRAEMVHHITPIKDNPALALRLDNLESLCNACHNEKHPEKHAGPREKADEPKHQMRIIKI